MRLEEFSEENLFAAFFCFKNYLEIRRLPLASISRRNRPELAEGDTFLFLWKYPVIAVINPLSVESFGSGTKKLTLDPKP